MTAGMVGFGALLWARRRLRSAEGPLQQVDTVAARRAARALLAVSGILTLLVGVIVGFRLHSGGQIGALSVALPALGLAWLFLLGVQTLRYRQTAPDPLTVGERPSRRPPNRDQVSKAQSPSAHQGPPDRHVSA